LWVFYRIPIDSPAVIYVKSESEFRKNQLRRSVEMIRPMYLMLGGSWQHWTDFSLAWRRTLPRIV